MANLNQLTFKCMWTIALFILFLLSYTASSSHSSTQEIHQNQNPTHYYLKNTDKDTISLSKQERFKKRRIERNVMKHRKTMVKNMQQPRAFSVMLPKGFVPPSGSSPCHNAQPNTASSSFHCHLTTAAQP